MKVLYCFCTYEKHTPEMVIFYLWQMARLRKMEAPGPKMLLRSKKI